VELEEVVILVVITVPYQNLLLATINAIGTSHLIFLTVFVWITSAIPSKCLDFISGNRRELFQVPVTYVRCTLWDVF
jgi:hypothetical protein